MKKLNLIFLSIMSIVLLANGFISAHAGEDLYGHHGMMNGMMSGAYGYGFAWLFGWIFMILVIVALVLFVIWLIKQIQKTEKRRGKK